VSEEGHHHDDDAPAQVRFAVLTVSDTRTKETDESGQLIIELVQAAFHVAAVRAICKDEPAEVEKLVRKACGQDAVDVLVVTGGTGIAKRDATYETIEGLYDVTLPGFGEIFRALSFEEIGAKAMLSRASAGVVNGRPVFSLPGSASAVKLAMDRLVLPEIGHVVAQARTRLDP
jgi:molybdenum cofactor biosynthesis protein B